MGLGKCFNSSKKIVFPITISANTTWFLFCVFFTSAFIVFDLIWKRQKSTKIHRHFRGRSQYDRFNPGMTFPMDKRWTVEPDGKSCFVFLFIDTCLMSLISLFGIVTFHSAIHRSVLWSSLLSLLNKQSPLHYTWFKYNNLGLIFYNQQLRIRDWPLIYTVLVQISTFSSNACVSFHSKAVSSVTWNENGARTSIFSANYSTTTFCQARLANSYRSPVLFCRLYHHRRFLFGGC